MPPASGAGRFPNLNDRAEGPARYAPPDHLLFVQAGTLFAQRFDVNTLQVGGEPVPIAENVGRVTDPGSARWHVSEDGTIAYRAESGDQRQFVWFDGTREHWSGLSAALLC
jgi:hypothetical protein